MMARTGRRSGTTDTRSEILVAAQASFSERGFSGTTIRSVAADAQVDPALVMHYFGSKADLYAAAIELPINPAIVDTVLFAGPDDEFAERVVRLFFTVWEQPEGRAPFLGMLRGAVSGHHQATEAFRDFISTALLGPIAERLGVDPLRVQSGLANMVGIAFMRYVIELEPLASADVEEIVAMVTPRIRPYFEG